MIGKEELVAAEPPAKAPAGGVGRGRQIALHEWMERARSGRVRHWPRILARRGAKTRDPLPYVRVVRGIVLRVIE
ncbi:MAG: hypothetical protein VB138_10990 [Burkholderia sp.]